jgi:carboxyl-terminal processing protease
VVLLGVKFLLAPWLQLNTRETNEQILMQAHTTILDNSLEPHTSSDLMRGAAEGMLVSLQDPYASFVGPEEMRRFEEDSSGTLVGIGVMLTARGVVLYPQPGGLAEAAQLRPGDRFLQVDSVEVSDWNMNQLTEVLRGEIGTEVNLLMEHADGTQFEAMIKRGNVPTLTVGDTRMLDSEAGIGHVHVRSFAGTTADEFERAMWRLSGTTPGGLKGLVLDLRWNIGGQLNSAIAIASFFLDGELVCSLEGRNRPAEKRFAARGRAVYKDLPVVLLVNEWSASGSEVLAAALRERGMAVLVGQRTYGKGIYQQVYDFEQGDFVLKFTAGYYTTPAGRILEGHLDPDLVGGLEADIHVQPVAENSAAIRTWLRRNPPPSRFRDEVHELFPAYRDAQPPTDIALETALNLLQRSLP